MKSVYKREDLKITEFDAEDVITTSGLGPDDPSNPDSRWENRYLDGGFSDGPNDWF